MKYLFIFSLLVISQIVNAQTSFQFVPEIQGRNADGLLSVKITSFSQQISVARMEIIVTEKKAGRLISVVTGEFNVMPGANTIMRNAASAASIQFADNNAARLIRQSGFFPEGEYEYCFKLYRYEKQSRRELLGEQCFDYVVEPLTPLSLIEPYHKEMLCEKRPVFTWQPSLPAIPGSQYRLTLVERREGQVAQEALVYNMPLINQTGITAPMLLYPSVAKSLEEGKSYTWQVTLYKEGVILNRSEIWDFTVKCSDTPVVENAEGFRDIENLARGNYYIASSKVLFALYNPYEEKNLDYSVFCLSNPAQQFKKLPKVKLQRGNNNITLDFSENNAFVEGYHYILTVRMPNNIIKKLRFTYKAAGQ